MRNIVSVLAEFGQAEMGLPATANTEMARQVMRLSALDWASVALAGQHEDAGRILRDIACAEAGQGRAQIIGAKGRFPARAAALVNGTISHALDYDDTHFAHIGHPSVAILPAALAVAQETAAPLHRFLDAALLGAEASIRTGLWLGRSHYQAGFHQTATAGAFGACLAAARLYRLRQGEIKQALAITASRAAGLKAQFGTMTKPYHAGLAAETGVSAARLAQAGFTANSAALDGAFGFGATHAGAADMRGFAGLGQVWQMQDIQHKFHACCHGTHAMIEALLPLAGTSPPDQIAALTIQTHPRWMPVCNIAGPQSGLQIKFSYAHIAALVLAGCDTAALDVFSDAHAQDTVLRELAAKVEVCANPEIDETASQICLTLRDGRAFNAQHDLNTPMDFAARRDRVLHKSATLLGRASSDALWAALSEVESEAESEADDRYDQKQGPSNMSQFENALFYQ